MNTDRTPRQSYSTFERCLKSCPRISIAMDFYLLPPLKANVLLGHQQERSAFFKNCFSLDSILLMFDLVLKPELHYFRCVTD